MSKNKKYRENSREDFLRYLDGNLSDRERNRIERELMKDPFEKEALEGLNMISPDEAREDLIKLDQKLHKRATKRKANVWYRVAAVAAVLVVISITFVTVFDDRISKFDRKVAETEKQPEEDLIERSEFREEVSTEVPEVPEAPAVESTEIALIPMEDATGPPDEEMEVEFAMESVEKEIMAMEPVAEETAPEDVYSGAGQRVLSGIVVSGEDSQPLTGVNLMLKGTSERTVSDMSGNFELPVYDDSNNTLVADFIGMESKEISITDQSEMEIMLQPDPAFLDEIVMIGYQAGKKSQRSVAMPAIATPETESLTAFVAPEPSVEVEEFKVYVERNIRFPDDSELRRAVVILNFKVGPDGRPHDITVLQSPAVSFEQEAIRLLNEGPDWDVMEIDGDSSGQSTSVRIVFKK